MITTLGVLEIGKLGFIVALKKDNMVWPLRERFKDSTFDLEEKRRPLEKKS